MHRHLAWIVLGIALTVSRWALADIVINPGFETGDFTGWTQSGNLDLTFVDGRPHTGTDAAWLGPTTELGFLSQMLTTAPSARYDIHLWLRHEPFGDGTPSQFQISWGGVLLYDQTDLGTFEYTEITLLHVVPTGAHTELMFGFREDTDYFQLDDISVQLVPEPNSLLLALAGIAGFPFLKRVRRSKANAQWRQARSAPHTVRADRVSKGSWNRRSARRAVAAALLAVAQALAATTARAQISDFSPEGIETFLIDNPTVRSPAAFLENLPLEYMQHWIMMTFSESAQTGTAHSPRIILPDANSSHVFGIDLTRNTIEYLHFEPATKTFRFHEIDTESGTVSIDDESCLACHASTRNGVRLSRPRPNWDAYDSWGGMLPFNRDRIYQNSLEETAFKQILQDLRTDPVIAQLELPKGVTRDAATGAIAIAYDPCAAAPMGSPEPCKTDSGMGMIDVTFDFAADGTVSFPGTDGSVMVTQGGKYLRLQHTLKGDNTDEGRGVALFDNFTKLNAQRVAQEIVDFPREPVDIRYVSLAIVKSCITSRILGKYAPKESLIKLLAYQAGLDANVKTFTDLLADTLERQERLPQDKADLQAKNLHDLIVANGGEPTPEVIAPEIARRSVETYELDMLTDFMIDREVYGDETMKLALFRLYLEGLGIAVDKWSLSVVDRSETYTFGDLFSSDYIPQIKTSLEQSLAGEGVECNDLAVASVKQYVKGF